MSPEESQIIFLNYILCVEVSWCCNSIVSFMIWIFGVPHTHKKKMLIMLKLLRFCTEGSPADWIDLYLLSCLRCFPTGMKREKMNGFGSLSFSCKIWVPWLSIYPWDLKERTYHHLGVNQIEGFIWANLCFVYSSNAYPVCSQSSSNLSSSPASSPAAVSSPGELPQSTTSCAIKRLKRSDRLKREAGRPRQRPRPRRGGVAGIFPLHSELLGLLEIKQRGYEVPSELRLRPLKLVDRPAIKGRRS